MSVVPPRPFPSSSAMKSNPGVLPDVPTVGDFVPGYEASALQGHWRAQGNARRDRRQAQHAAVMRAEAKLQRLLDRAVGWGNPDRPLFFDTRNALDFMQLLAFAGVDRARKHAKTFEPLVDLHPRFFSSSCDLAQVKPITAVWSLWAMSGCGIMRNSGPSRNEVPHNVEPHVSRRRGDGRCAADELHL
jgi:hypothetical protein